MKITILLLSLFPFIGISQTLQYENRHLYSFEGREFKQKQKEWLKFLAEVKEYPDLCWNEKEKAFICEYKVPFKVSQDEAFNKAKDWIAETFRNYKAVVDYENPSSRKIVLKPLFSFNETFYYKFLGTQEVSVELKTYKTIVITVLYETVIIKFQDFQVSSTDGTRIPLENYFPLVDHETYKNMLSYYNIATKIMENVDLNFLSFKKYFD